MNVLVRNKKGFTLVELLVTTTIMGFVLVSVCALLMQSISAHRQTVVESELQDKAIRAENQLSHDLTGAYLVFDAGTDRLSIVDQDYTDADPHYISYYVENGRLYRVAYDTGTPQYSGGEVVTDGIGAMDFSYYEWDYTDYTTKDVETYRIDPGSTETELREVHQVIYNITFRVDGHDYTICRQAKLRNNPRT